jgi:uncharacterized protein YciI
MTRVDDLVSKMLAYQLYVIFWHGKGLDIVPKLAEHLEYLIDVEKAGKLFASGPLGPREKKNGMTIVRANSLEEAEEIARNEPFCKAGLRDFTIEPWTIMEGSITVSVNYSDGSMTIK